MTGSSELNVKTGDWVVLQCGIVIGPIFVKEEVTTEVKCTYENKGAWASWDANGKSIPINDETDPYDIVAVLTCPPLERIRQLEKHVEQLQDKCNAICACSYDHPDDVCLAHSPKLKAAEERITQLEDALRFYADEKQYQSSNELLECGCCFDTFVQIKWDSGSKARQALEINHDHAD